MQAIHRIEGALCSVCGERIFSPYASEKEDDLRCGLCRRVNREFSRAVAFGSYEAELRDLIHLLKFEGVRPAAEVLGQLLAAALVGLQSSLPDDRVQLVPVPLHRVKLRQRGFNQAELIARAALQLNSKDPRFQLCPKALVRTRDTASQVGLTGHQRRENLRGAFAVADTATIRDRNVVVIDDVYTTGATASECARVLGRAGAKRIWVATVARTLKNSQQELGIAPQRVGADPESSARTAAG